MTDCERGYHYMQACAADGCRCQCHSARTLGMILPWTHYHHGQRCDLAECGPLA